MLIVSLIKSQNNAQIIINKCSILPNQEISFSVRISNFYFIIHPPVPDC